MLPKLLLPPSLFEALGVIKATPKNHRVTHSQVPHTAPAGVPGALKRSLALQMDSSKGEERSTPSPGSGLPEGLPCQYPGEEQSLSTATAASPQVNIPPQRVPWWP